ncbi:hypothetical protein JMM61_18245 [Rhodovulum sulfidophilum]|uniref:ABC-three component system protein n=1 Tax=Rhodovulum sulfidophilum TaxID=35806 RepID=UPI00192522A9|nr:ABC-three component system protein [Rhodovulum sulfidophilum]MBL3587297.1 hypothetical protein [Rhodovulum sulfidophilum]
MTTFSAVDPALGYLYQARFALLEALRRLGDERPFSIFLETLDDVVFDQDGGALDLLQLKHHRVGTANLTDSSTDLWKSLRIWIEGRSSGTIPKDARLFLVTTAQVGQGSAAAYLRTSDQDRDVQAAVRALLSTATTSQSSANSAAYSLFRKLNEDDRITLASVISILPGVAGITDLDRELRREIWSAARQQHRESLLSRLEGWWYGRVVNQLRSSPVEPILSEELQLKLDDLRDQFHQDALPIDEEIFDVGVDLSPYAESPFVQQLELSGVNKRRILRAVQDFYRAFAQRSRWIREDLLELGELGRYERRLTEEWEIVFEQIADEVGADAAEETSRQAAQRLCKWVEDADIPIRPRISERSLTRGSLHMLADEMRVGWHPHFRERLRHLLMTEAAS